MSRLFSYKYSTTEAVEGEAPNTAEEIEIDTVGKTETFWTRNVKLLTFLICIFAFLALFGPISVFRIADYIEEQNAGEEMTVEELLALAELHETLTMRAFEDYEKQVSEAESFLFYYITVDLRYSVMIGAQNEKATLNYFTVTDIQTDKKIDVMVSGYTQDALKAFLSD